MSTAKSIVCFFFEHNLPKPTWTFMNSNRKFNVSLDGTAASVSHNESVYLPVWEFDGSEH